MVKKIPLLFIVFVLVSLGFSCREKYTPRPMGYLRFAFPPQTYEPLSLPAFTEFEKPVYMSMVHRNSPAEEFWFDLSYQHYGTTIHFSYKPVKGNLAGLAEDVHYFVYKHTIKASGIEEILINHPENKVFGTLYRIRGDVASNIQFAVTDSLKHFLRGSLYIASRPNEDSLAPIIDFSRRDIEHILSTLRWK